MIVSVLKGGSDVNAQDMDGWTPLHAAAHWGQREACQILCEHMADMEIRNYVVRLTIDWISMNFYEFYFLRGEN